MKSDVPELRLRVVGDRPARPDGDRVVYWMTASRRLDHNFGLDRAMEWARELGKPLLVYEGLRADYRWASDRMHRFVVDGMADHARRAAGRNVRYVADVEREPGAAKARFAKLTRKACVVVTDDYPCFFLPRMLDAAGERLDARLEAVDSNGLLPMRATERVFKTAASFRRFLQQELPEHLDSFPRERPSFHTLPDPDGPDEAPDVDLARLPIDHAVTPVDDAGGPEEGKDRWERFLEDGLDGYGASHDAPVSGLSPYLHFGHVAPHRLFRDLTERHDWDPGRRDEWWGFPDAVASFLDQLVTWRELGFNMCAHAPGYDTYGSLPAWARETLDEHASDPREHVYSLEEFEAADTHDEVWNLAQRQLRDEGRIFNYLRMLWGKKILEWSRSPEEALATMLELNNKYALDGRDPNSYSGIFWILGRYDRAWGPERPVFGKIRYMSSDATRRKLKLGRRAAGRPRDGAEAARPGRPRR